MSGSHQLFFERHEYKYLIPPHMIPPIREALRTVCDLDPHAGPDGGYLIRSLYFDTRSWDLFWANEREQDDRFKVRVRSYPGTTAPVFLEVKRRVLDVIIKTRVAVPADRWADVVASPGGIDAVEWKRGTRPFAERFLSLVHTHHLDPVVVVDYYREAYASTVDDYARATFDQAIRAQVRTELDLDVDERLWTYVDHPVQTQTPEARCVLELKFGRTVPPWMTALVRRFDLLRFEFSKYCYSLRNLYFFPALRDSSLARRWRIDRV